jgi:hypothetical protein
MTIVSSVPKILARSAMAEDIDAGIRLTPPYGKSAIAVQMRHAIAAMQATPAIARRRHRKFARSGHGPRAGGGAANSAFAAAAFLHSRRNFLRSLPLSPLASASFEHSSEAAVRGFSAFFSAGALASVLVASVLAGAVVCADAAPISRREATAVAVARAEIFVMGHLGLKQGRNRRAVMLNHR